MFSPVLKDVVTSKCIRSPRAPHWICITQAAKRDGNGPFQGLMSREGVSCSSTGLAVWLSTEIQETCLKQRGWEKEQCQPSLVSHHPAGGRATERVRPTLNAKMSQNPRKYKGVSQLSIKLTEPGLLHLCSLQSSGMPKVIQFSLITAVLKKRLLNHY